MAATALVPSFASAADPGRLDPTFGPAGGAVSGVALAAGLVPLDVGSRVAGVAAQPDGKIVVVGSTGPALASRLYAIRLNADGTRDDSFNADLPAPGAIDVAEVDGLEGTGVAVQANGQIVLSATALTGTLSYGMVAVRLNGDGGRDTSFDTDGVQVVKPSFAGQGDARSVAVTPSGEVVLGGSALASPTDVSPAATIARIQPNGKLDGPLGTGVQITSDPSQIRSVAVDGAGRITGVGEQQHGQSTEALVARVNDNGSLDTDFRGGASSEQLARGGAARSAYNGVALLPDGGAVATGVALQTGGAGSLSVTSRFLANGQFAAFGDAGRRFLDASTVAQVSAPEPGGYGVVANGGHTYVVGSFSQNGAIRLSATALDAAGNPIAGFGDGGSAHTGVGATALPIRGTSAALTSTGLVAGGTITIAGASPTTYGVVARYGAFQPVVDNGGETPGPDGPSVPDSPGGPIGPGGPGETTRPAVLSKLSLRPKVLRPKTKTKLSYTLSSAARVTLTVEQLKKGRKTTVGTGKKARTTCAKPTKKTARKGRCTYYSPLKGTRELTGKAGGNTVVLTTKVIERKLAPGKYRLVLSVRGSKAAPKRLTLTVVKK